MTIFVAEDNPGDLYLLRLALCENAGQQPDVVCCDDGEQALSAVQSGRIGKPDLIVLDLNLPKHDGTEVLRAVRESREYSHVPVVVLTSSDSPRDREHAIELGADRFITKPPTLDAFLAIGRELLGLLRPARSQTAAG